TPAANPFLAKAMQILLRHAGKPPPAGGQPGLFSLGASGGLGRLFADSGVGDCEHGAVALPLRMRSAAQALALMREALGALRAIVSDRPEAVRAAAWAEVAETLKTFETGTGFIGPAEVLVAAGAKPA